MSLTVQRVLAQCH